MLTKQLHHSLPSVLAVLAFACSGGDVPPPPDGVHSVRAEIVQLPRAAGEELYLRHESIPEFRDAGGKRVGMSTMTMPFAVAAGVDLAGYAEADRVEVDLEVRWQGPTPLLVTRLERLPPDTRLEFDPAPQPGAEPVGDPETGAEADPGSASGSEPGNGAGDTPR